jgi:hypothetical protein
MATGRDAPAWKHPRQREEASTIPNWYIHVKWACKLGISEPVAHVVNRLVDYGSFSTYFMADAVDDDGTIVVGEADDRSHPEAHEHILLKYMYRKDPTALEYVKAYYVHLMLDHLKETRHRNLGDAMDEFKRDKALLKMKSRDGVVVSFEGVVDEMMSFFRANEQEIMADVRGV